MANPLATYQLSLPESPDADLRVVSVTLDDNLDELFTLELGVHTTAPDLSPADFVGRSLHLEAPSLDAALRLHGVVAAMRQDWAEDKSVSRYRFVVRPWLWLTTLRTNSRIFQDTSAIELIAALVADHAPHVPPCVEQLGGSYPRRPYTAQYGETDWDMIRRQAADFGVSLLAVHDGSGAVALADALASTATRVADAIPFAGDRELLSAEPHVLDAAFDTELRPAMATVRDHDYLRPRLDLDGAAFDADAVTAEQRLERFAYRVERFADLEAGSALAVSRLEEARTGRHRARFRTNVAASPGTLFTLAGHPRADANGEWIVIGATTRATVDRAHHELLAVPAHCAVRPARKPAPRVIGTQTARVVGPEGEEIDVDAEGRVCVRFRWDRRDKQHDTTRRVRVSQAWAGPGYGLTTIPRVGDEVVVDFLDGDPDQPLIVGRVHNGTNPPPQQLPEQKAWSTWRSRSTPGGEGFNEITLDDNVGQERIYVHAQRDVIVDVENDVKAHVKGHVDALVRGNGTGGVKGDGSLSIDGDASLKVGGDLTAEASNITATASADIVLSAGAQRHDESTNHFVRTGGFYVKASSVAQFVTANFHVFASDIKLQAGGSVIHLTSGGIDISSDGPVVVNGSVIKLN